MKNNRRKHDIADPADFEDLAGLPIPAEVEREVREVRSMRKPPKPGHAPKADPVAAELFAEQVDGLAAFDFSYAASRHERQWILDSLGNFFEAQWFDDILRLIKGGKEANVYQCVAKPEFQQPFIAAKVYRPRKFRNLKNDHVYREGRANLDADGNEINDDGMLHAIRKRTQYGLELTHASWIEYEFQTLSRLHAAGADVPEAYARGDNAILMGYIGDEDTPAPTLNSVHLRREEAQPLFERVIHNVELMLKCDRVHGDLSAYNILYWDGAITLIDFPQVIQPEANASSYRIFERDVTRVCEYFARYGVRARARQTAADLWTAFGHRLTPEVNPRFLNDQDERDLAFWKSQQ